MPEPVSFVKAAQEFFSKDPHGRKLEVTEFKELTYQERLEIRELLIAEGYNVTELKAPPPEPPGVADYQLKSFDA